MKFVSSVVLTVGCLVYGASIAFADNAELHEALRPSLVVIESHGILADGTPAQSFRMGFIVSDGLVLTTYSLLTSLGNVKPESITISAAPAGPSRRPEANLPAVIYSEDTRHNLLLLYVKGLKRDKHLDLGDSAAFTDGTMLTPHQGTMTREILGHTTAFVHRRAVPCGKPVALM